MQAEACRSEVLPEFVETLLGSQEGVELDEDVLHCVQSTGAVSNDVDFGALDVQLQQIHGPASEGVS